MGGRRRVRVGSRLTPDRARGEPFDIEAFCEWRQDGEDAEGVIGIAAESRI